MTSNLKAALFTNMLSGTGSGIQLPPPKKEKPKVRDDIVTITNHKIRNGSLELT